ncbi:aconitate hydratase [Thermoleophilum album]|uniref:Aconitate hydratase A n=1 Tax=Thermoleophilum album TaxID=29539 RepID=A0A1H6FSH7_THEAL|nr:aconitate hydratase [Thermoleophilum album]SEH13846.1 aconitate hydratase [Thermoleophilum album]
MAHPDSFGARGKLVVAGRELEIYRLDALQARYDVARLPYSLKILLENLLRHEDGQVVTADDIEAVARWDAKAEPTQEIRFTPARVLMQDFTGVPAIVDLASMRDAMDRLGGDATRINPQVPVDLVIDHSIQVDVFGRREAFRLNAKREFERNRERYAFLRWGQEAFDNFRVVPPNTGICHQVNLEYLATVVHERDGRAFPDTLVGTDSHTTMINGLGVLGWGVGGIEAEAAMLGQPISMLLPQVVGFRLTGRLPEGATATDLVLTVTQMLRQKGVVGKFVEFFGEGLRNLPLADRATIGNMAPEYGATCGIFPVDRETLRYLEFTGRPRQLIELVEAYCRAQGLFHDEASEEAVYSDVLELDLGDVEPSIAGPRRPQDRIALRDAAKDFVAELRELADNGDDRPLDPGVVGTFPASDPPAPGDHADGSPDPTAGHHHAVAVSERPTKPVPVRLDDGSEFQLDHGAIVISAITSCTNTSNPSVMVGAGLVAKKAVERGLARKPWVKTSLAPGSKVVTDYLERAGLVPYLEQLGFALVGYGCTTCIGNSGPLPEPISRAIQENDLVVCSVLSGNRNFEGRIHPDVRMNYLASPPLCVAYAIAGRMDVDLYNDPLGVGNDGEPVYLRDIWPTQQEIQAEIERAIESDMYRKEYAAVFEGDETWRQLPIPRGARYEWDPASTYVKRAPYFDDMAPEPPSEFERVEGARILCLLGDSVTTDHISPAGAIKLDSPAGRYLIEHGVEPRDFNSYGSRRGNHEVMVRGTFANVRLRNRLAPGTEGGFTVKLPEGEETTIYEAAVRYAEQGVPLGVLAGREYGSGSSRDWAAKGPRLLGVRFVIAQSFERIHRSNLVGMGILPLEFMPGESVETLGLSGRERYDLEPLEEGRRTLRVRATPDDGGQPIEFETRVRIDTPNEWLYYRHGGILQYVLRRLLGTA